MRFKCLKACQFRKVYVWVLLWGMHTLGKMLWYWSFKLFEGLPVQESMYDYCCGECIHWIKCKCDMRIFSVQRFASSGKYMYEYCCGECIHWVKCCKCDIRVLSVWRLASSGKYIYVWVLLWGMCTLGKML